SHELVATVFAKLRGTGKNVILNSDGGKFASRARAVEDIAPVYPFDKDQIAAPVREQVPAGLEEAREKYSSDESRMDKAELDRRIA
ncbi:hypothetical protein ABK046_48345, partial [Streptomyces caeruleatus]